MRARRNRVAKLLAAIRGAVVRYASRTAARRAGQASQREAAFWAGSRGPGPGYPV